MNDAPQVHRENALPVLQRTKAGAVRADAGIVHQDIGAAEPLLHRSFKAREVVEAADVNRGGHHIGGPALGNGCQSSRGLREPVFTDIGDAYFHAEAGKACCGGKPDAGGASGDDGNIAG